MQIECYTSIWGSSLSAQKAIRSTINFLFFKARNVDFLTAGYSERTVSFRRNCLVLAQAKIGFSKIGHFHCINLISNWFFISGYEEEPSDFSLLWSMSTNSKSSLEVLC